MTKRFILFILISLTASVVCSQEWTTQDSIKLNRILQGNEEIKLNPEAVKQIDFGSDVMGTPLMSTEKSWMLPDATLPSVLPNTLPLNKKQMLTLRPYKPNTPYDWDPVYQKKIKVGQDTWRGDPFYRIKTLRSYTNMEKVPQKPKRTGGVPSDIEAVNLRYNPLMGQANGAMAGVGIGGLDFMSIFTKDFWDVKGRERRGRTLEILKAYGDSTTRFIPMPILQPIAH